jgi:hypothetical protein
MPIELRHPHNGLRQRGVQVPLQTEEVVTVSHEPTNVFEPVEIQFATQAGQDQAQDERVGQRVMVADQVFPASVSQNVDRGDERLVVACHPQVLNSTLALIDINRPPGVAHDIHRALHGLFQPPQFRAADFRRHALFGFVPDLNAGHSQAFDSA